MAEPSPVPLPCGRDPDELVDQVWDGRGHDLDDHQRSCPHCRARLRRHQHAHALVTDLSRVRVQAPTGFVHRVMQRVRDGDATDVPIHVGRTGTTSVSATVVELLATVAAHDVRGITAVRGVVAGDGALTMAVTVDVHRPVPDTVAAVRHHVAHSVERLAGLTVGSIDITVRDVVMH